ncbi:MAG TPA: hypothetical protein VF240_03330 [Pyrinomonadaceae bacterium]
MSSKLTVIFYIILCLEAGVVLTLLPWVRPFGLIGDWGDNYFLVVAAQKAGLQGLQQVVSSGWVRGAVTGLGVLNFLMAFWEMAHFNQTVRAIQTQADAHDRSRAAAEEPAGPTPRPDGDAS